MSGTTGKEPRNSGFHRWLKTGWAKVALSMVVLAAAVLLASCSESDSLGDEPVTEVLVGSPPTWSNGIGKLMGLKCAVCHQVPPSPVSPNGIPNYFDLNYFDASFHPDGVSGAQDSLQVRPQIGLGILRMPLSPFRQMPLDFATPLTEREKTALEAWAVTGAF